MRKLAIFAAAFALSAVGVVYFGWGVRALWIAGACLVLSVLCRRLGLRRLCIAGMGVAVGLMWCHGYQWLFLKDAAALDQTEQTVRIRITDMPYERGYGAAAHGRLDGYGAVIYADETLLSAKPGDTVVCTASVRMQRENRYFRADGVVLTLFAEKDLQIEPGTPDFHERVRQWLQQSIDAHYDGEVGGLIKALLTGDRSGLSFHTQNSLSVAGLSHAVAVSGMHVSILLMMISMLCGHSPKLTALLGIPMIGLFVLVTGASASACRAAVMNILLLCSALIHREQDPPTALGAAALVLLLQNPWCIADVSFQLSFAAVAGLMTLSGPIRQRILEHKKNPGKLLKFVASGISASLGATLATMPLTIFYFGIVSLVALFTNLLTLWAVTAVFALSLSSCILGAAGVPVVWVASLLSRYILAVCDLAASFPFAAAYMSNIPLMCWAVVSYFLVGAMLTYRRLPYQWILSAMTVGFLLCIIPARIGFTASPWRLTALDVGQGQCLVLQISDYTAVIDCGGSDPEEAGEQAARFLHSAGVSHADALILTHYDEDHAGGTEQFLSRVQTDMVYLPPVRKDASMAEAIESASENVTYVDKLHTINLPGVNISVLPPVSKENDNNAGITILATAEEYDMLITGDLDAGAESLLIANWNLPQVELLVAGHHGAKTSTSRALLLTVCPQTVLISAGADNSYGHPHEEVLQRLQEFGAQIYRTDQDGTIIITP